MGIRVIAVGVVVALGLAGPLAPLGQAQTAAPGAPAPAAAKSDESRPDVYDVGAGVVTALKAPFNVGLCVMGVGVGAAVFALTLGSAYKFSTRLVEEGCRGPWVVRGEDLRPEARTEGPAFYQESR